MALRNGLTIFIYISVTGITNILLKETELRNRLSLIICILLSRIANILVNETPERITIFMCISINPIMKNLVNERYRGTDYPYLYAFQLIA